MLTLHHGDCRDILATLPSASIDMCMTSPPYWNLRDYKHDAQLGREATPQEYVANLVAVMREVRRILKPHGTLWLNLGDTYASAGGSGGQGKNGDRNNRAFTQPGIAPKCQSYGMKPKDLVGIPWRVAFALQDDGWWLRQDIIWSKPNPMPESVRDRCVKAHEYIFLLSKSEHYHFDCEAIEEPAGKDLSGNLERKTPAQRGAPEGGGALAGSVPWEGETRRKRSVWTVASEPFPDAHFATYPTALVETAIRAGCPAGGVVLDPFMGSGTTALASLRLGKDCVGVEANPDYIQMAKNRCQREFSLYPVRIVKGGVAA